MGAASVDGWFAARAAGGLGDGVLAGVASGPTGQVLSGVVAGLRGGLTQAAGGRVAAARSAAWVAASPPPERSRLPSTSVSFPASGVGRHVRLPDRADLT
jgi:hypothetical protein